MDLTDTNLFVIALLDQLCAADETPLRLGQQHAFTPRCLPVSGPRMQWLRRQYQYGNEDHASLARGLVGFGGEFAVIPANDPELDTLIQRGQLWGPAAETAVGRPHLAHSNASQLWQWHPERVFIATGYALPADGVWRRHTWCVKPTEDGTAVIETTEKHELYFGFVLTLHESVRFARLHTRQDPIVTDAMRDRYDVVDQVPFAWPAAAAAFRHDTGACHAVSL